MIKQIWRIRSNAKLFNGLNMVISFFMLFYSILTVVVLPEKVNFSVFLASWSFTNQSKFLLLILPTFSVILCLLLYHLTCAKKAMVIHAKSTDKSKVAKLKVTHDSLIGFNFLLTLTLAFVQVDILNSAKQIKEFSFYPIIACLIGLIAYIVVVIIKHKKLK